MSELAPSLSSIDPKLVMLNDICCGLLQEWVDKLAGKACPLLADNRRLTDMVTARAQLFGLELYLPLGDDFVRVSIEAGPTRAQRLDPDHPSVAAGQFNMWREWEPLDNSPGQGGNLTSWIAFPQLVIARSKQHARERWQSRAEQVQTPGNRSDGVDRSPPSPKLTDWDPH